MYNKTCIIISGPTASGKTPLAISLAAHFNTAIISADSRQCYRELNIGVAKPGKDELLLVPHYFINSHSIHEQVTAVTFEQYAIEKAEMLFQEHNVIIMAGGTGLYINAFMHGLDDIPAISPGVRASITDGYTLNGISWLQQHLEVEDPHYISHGDMENPQRMMRALEVIRETGRPIFHFHQKNKKSRNFNLLQIGIDLPRNELYERINERVDHMMRDGLEEEVNRLLPYKQLNALQTVGYRELFEYFNGSVSLNRSVELIKQHTRHYAKRQLTWFRKNEGITWLGANEIEKFVTEKITGY